MIRCVEWEGMNCTGWWIWMVWMVWEKGHEWCEWYAWYDEMSLDMCWCVHVLVDLWGAVHNSGVCSDTTILRVGEVVGNPPQQEYVVSGHMSNARHFANMVLCHCIPLLWTHQLRSGSLVGHIHRLHHSMFGPHGLLPQLSYSNGTYTLTSLETWCNLDFQSRISRCFYLHLSIIAFLGSQVRSNAGGMILN